MKPNNLVESKMARASCITEARLLREMFMKMPQFTKAKQEIKQPKRFTWKKLEEWVKKELAKGGIVLRADHKNFMPDFIFVKDGGKASFVECKRYSTSHTVEDAWERWARGQSGQFHAFHKLALEVPVYVVILLANGELHVGQLNGANSGPSPSAA